MKKTITALSIAALAFLSFGATAIAAGEVTPDDGSLLDLAKPMLDAIVNHQYWLAVAAGVVVAVALARKYAPSTSTFGKLLNTELGGMVCAALISFTGAIANSVMALGIKMPTLAVLATAGKITFVAVGGWMVLHKLATILVATKWWAEHAPAWLKALVSFVLGLIGSSAIAKAEKAGQAAVDANPPQGPAAVSGEIGKI